jgi:hypothetical protein
MLPEGLVYVNSWVVDDGGMDQCFQLMETSDPAKRSRVQVVYIPEGLAAGAGPGGEGSLARWRPHNGSAPWVLCPAGRDRLAIRRLLSSQEVGVRPSRMDQAGGQQLQGHGAAEE